MVPGWIMAILFHHKLYGFFTWAKNLKQLSLPRLKVEKTFPSASQGLLQESLLKASSCLRPSPPTTLPVSSGLLTKTFHQGTYKLCGHEDHLRIPDDRGHMMGIQAVCDEDMMTMPP